MSSLPAHAIVGLMLRAARLLLAPALALAGPLLAAPAQAATIAPTTTQDVVALDGQCSLREAISAANDDVAGGAPECTSGSGADIIELAPASTYVLDRVGSEDLNGGGDLDVLEGLTIRPAGPGTATIVQTAADRVIDVRAESLVLERVRVTGGRAPAGQAGAAGSSAVGGAGADGGGIRCIGATQLALTGAAVFGNRAG